MKYENTGAPHHRPDGSVVETGAVFEPTERELLTWGRKFKLVDGQDDAPKMGTNVPTTTATGKPVLPPVTDKRWKLSMHPDLYLKLHPEGTHAATARAVLGLPAVTETSDGSDH